MKFFFRIIAIVAFAFCQLTTKAELTESAANDTFQMANTAYKAGNYAVALRMYKQVLSSGFESEELYYNLGNAYFRNQQVPRAIWCYEKTLLINPSNEDAAANLKLANLSTDKIEPLPELFSARLIQSLLQWITPSAWTTISIIFIWISILGFVLYILLANNAWRRVGFYSGIVGLVFFILLTIVSYSSFQSLKNPGTAIVFSPNVYVKSAPEESSADLFIVHEGLKVKILDAIGDWYKVKLADGKVGWMEKNNVELL